MLWGIDLGGTKIEGAILDEKDDMRVLIRERIPTEGAEGYDHVVLQIAKLVKQMETQTGLRPEKIGIGTPGSLDPILNTLKNCNTTALNGKPLKSDLEATLGIPVAIANDANCFAVAEANMGIVKEVMPEAEVVFGVIMGSGVGGGIVVNGRVLNGRQGIAGEWGHNLLDENGPRCYCGKVGCVETIISGPSLERYYESLTGNFMKLRDITAAVDTDKAAAQTVDRLINYFGKAIANIVNILDPDAIVLGGGVGNIDVLYTEGVEAARPYVFNNRFDTVFLKPKLGDSAGVFGAAFL